MDAPLTGRFYKYKVSLKNRETKLHKELLKSIALLKYLKRIKHDCKVLLVEKEFPHKSKAEVISNASVGRQRGLSSKDRVISSVKIELVGQEKKATRAFLPWCGAEVSESCRYCHSYWEPRDTTLPRILCLFSPVRNCLNGDKGIPWQDVLPSKVRREVRVNNMSDSRALPNVLKRCISHKCSTIIRAARDMLIGLLGYGTLVSQKGAAAVIIRVRE